MKFDLSIDRITKKHEKRKIDSLLMKILTSLTIGTLAIRGSAV